MLQVNRSARAARARRGRTLRRVLFAAAGSVVVGTSLAAVPAPAAALPALTPPSLTPPSLTPPSLQGPGRSADHLTVTVRNGGDGVPDRTYQLYCHPGGGDHPDVGGACAALERGTRWGKDAFAPVPGGSFCTMQYGGPATAHVTGTWAGRPVNARYDRTDGCQIARWDRLVPLLPDLRQKGQS
ncbi:SSI family serine proteinase inhibitor [Streptomyces viridochromogenes]|uniref:SSI family serine proteinase inhibitor n=1 Tax=Streptomyces viridochromogenes TaxID=1938 RepID=UPI00068F9205|nr:SSI family serine proteinase inhibitor [Streptomyces viridochromogenes]